MEKLNNLKPLFSRNEERYISKEVKGKMFFHQIACVADAKRGGGGGREKGEREGSACCKSLCFCITPTIFW